MDCLHGKHLSGVVQFKSESDRYVENEVHVQFLHDSIFPS